MAMSNHIDTMKQALDLIEGEFPHLPEDRAYAAITALRRAIEQAEKQDCNCADQRDCDGRCCVQAQKQEPVAYYDAQEHTFRWSKPTSFGYVPVTVKVEPIPLYTAPPQRQPVMRRATRDEKIVNPGVYEVPVEPNVTLSCGCKSHYLGIPAEWDEQTREGEPAVACGNICERHWHEYDARHPPPPQRQPLTERENELIDGMIEVQLHHAAQCDRIANRTMAEKQKGWDMERVELLRKLKAAHGIGGKHE